MNKCQRAKWKFIPFENKKVEKETGIKSIFLKDYDKRRKYGCVRAIREKRKEMKENGGLKKKENEDKHDRVHFVSISCRCFFFLFFWRTFFFCVHSKKRPFLHFFACVVHKTYTFFFLFYVRCVCMLLMACHCFRCGMRTQLETFFEQNNFFVYYWSLVKRMKW